VSGLEVVTPMEEENTYYVVNEGEEEPEPEEGAIG